MALSGIRFRVRSLMAVVALVAVTIGVGRWSASMWERSERYRREAARWRRLTSGWITLRDQPPDLFTSKGDIAKFHWQRTVAARHCEEFAARLDVAATYPWQNITLPKGSLTVPDSDRYRAAIRLYGDAFVPERTLLPEFHP